MEGKIVNFRGGKHTQNTRQMVVLPENAKKETSEQLVGKTVTWMTPTKKAIKGQVSAIHGRNGAVRVIFEKGMPGQSLGTKVKIE